jgi:gas vesicle protein
MTDNHKFLAGLLLGAAAGAALALFLNSEKGKEIINNAKEGAEKLEDDLHNKWEEFDTLMNDILQKGKSFIDDLEQKAKQTAS